MRVVVDWACGEKTTWACQQYNGFLVICRRWESVLLSLPRMRNKPRIAIVGAGNLAGALAVALHRAGYVIEAVMGRTGASSRRRARQLAREVGAVELGVGSFRDTLTADLVWFCVPDSEISKAAREAAHARSWSHRIAFHSSGALASDELNPLRRAGAAVASVHPLMTFVRGSRPPFAGVSFAVEGDTQAIRLARTIVNELGGRAYPIRKRDKAAYHAWGTFVSPLFTALLVTSQRVASLAGAKGKSAKKRMIPILLQTLANYASFEAGRAFSGPIIRGDVDTVRRHLRVLRQAPIARDVYRALATAALQYLPAKNKRELERALAR